LFLTPAIADDTAARVKAVLDGDTVVLEDGRRVRYLGVNTPEWQEPFSLKAKRLNKSLVEGKTVRLEFDKRKTDGYKRLLAYVFVDGSMVNEKILEEGLGHAFLFPPNDKYNSKFLDIQKRAKAGHKGMWAKYDESITLKITQLKPPEYKKDKWTSAYVRVVNLAVDSVSLKGYALSTSNGQQYIFPDYKLEPGFTVVISDKGKDGYSRDGQLSLYWKELSTAWKKNQGTAILTNPEKKVIGVYRYKGRRIFYNTSQ
jgi:endonuclease YncB( thermonuclease family)